MKYLTYVYKKDKNKSSEFASVHNFATLMIKLSLILVVFHYIERVRSSILIIILKKYLMIRENMLIFAPKYNNKVNYGTDKANRW